MREKIAADLKTAMKAGERAKVDALRLINAALKDKDIEARGAGKTLGDDDLLALLQKMIKSRQESVEIYEKAGRTDLADKEKGEIAVISAYLPQQLSEVEVAEAVKAAIAEVGATSIKDMGKVVAVLKSKYTGRMDFGKASAAVKAALSAG
ncbi:MAG: GatB/YqeY domain-containing protein [Alphaproteobacteria bacterium]|nr:GatB/YqeY domain-containing protein [Alphaproteobacteria bacterium]MBM3653186.1 GatB/YqeY domain-containing protein [Alphaproteobacteria bacterium]